MTDQKQATKRRDLRDICFTLRQTSLHRAAEIIEDLVKQRDELEEEVEGLKVARDMMGRLWEKAEAERDQALAASAAREIAMRDRASNRASSWVMNTCSPVHVAEHRASFLKDRIQDLPLSTDGQQALNKMLADAWDDGYQAGLYADKIHRPNPHRKGAT